MTTSRARTDLDVAVDELRATIDAVIAATNEMWSTGRLPAGSVLYDVAPDLQATQWSPKFEDGVWRAASGQEWLDGTAEAADALAGRGCRWTAHHVQVLPRSEDEAVASYRIEHHWGDDRPAAQAFFLETWRRGGDGRWRLARHTAEKV